VLAFCLDKIVGRKRCTEDAALRLVDDTQMSRDLFEPGAQLVRFFFSGNSLKKLIVWKEQRDYTGVASKP
jgi:hypothetical protein